MDHTQAAKKRPEPTDRQASFDPVQVGQRECDVWAAYYRHEWASFLRSAVGMGRRQPLVAA